MHNLIVWTEGDSLKATTLAKRLLCMSPEGLVRQRTSGKRQLYARAVFQADSLAVMTKLLSGSRTLSRGVRVRGPRTATSTMSTKRRPGKRPTTK